MATSSTVTDRVKDLFSSFISNFEKPKDYITVNESGSKSPGKVGDFPSKPDERKTTTCTSAARNKMLYYDRVETYSDLSPLVCARYGWRNVETDMLQCVHCKAFLSGQLPKAVNTEGYRESCNKLKKNLTSCHENQCTWSSNPCPELFSRVPYHNQEELSGDFRYRLVSLQCTSDKLPAATYTTVLEQDLTMDKLQISVEEILKRVAVPELENVRTDVVLFAVCGWTYSEGQMDILQCSCCRRKVGLWNYSVTDRCKDTNASRLSSESGSSVKSEDGGTGTCKSKGDGDEDDAEPLRKKTKIEKQSFDPVSEHRYWCPWIQPSSLPPVGRQRMNTTPESSPVKLTTPTTPPRHSPGPKSSMEEEVSKVPAWFLVMRILSHEGDHEADFCSQMKQSPQVEGLRHLRKVLRECTSPTSPPKMPDLV